MLPALPGSRLVPCDPADVVLGDGPLKAQYDETRAFFAALPDDDIIKGFRSAAGLPAPGTDLGGWCQRTSAVVFGQWLGGMARMGRAGDTAMADKARRLATGWGATLPTIGLGHYAYDKYVGGLVDMIAYLDDDGAADLLRRLTDRAESALARDRVPASDEDSQGGFFNGQLEWYTLGENLWRAALVTRDQRYARFADVWRYPGFWDMFTGAKPCAPWGFHGYSHCNALNSLAMAAVVDADPRLIAALVRAHDFFVDTQCYATGGYGPGEKLMRDDGALGRSLVDEPNGRFLRHQVGRSFETPCGTWAVFKLCHYLMRLTGEARFGDWLERVLYNGAHASLPICERGMTFYYADYRLMGGTKTYHSAAFPCCSGTYLQDVAEYPGLIWWRADDGVRVNLFVPSTLRIDLGGVAITLIQETVYPDDGLVRITVRTPAPVSFALRCRVPAWATGMTGDAAGEPFACTPGAWAGTSRTWRDGEVLTLRLPLVPRLVPIDRQHPDRVAIAAGPAVLVRVRETMRLSDLGRSLDAGAKPLEYRLRGASEEWLVPFHRVGHGVPYRMYVDLERG
ncbi:MAG TPA: beta-L-arabinofuranosidase domain-containing protein [Planctomycetota bacterium]|nr:beta-L-arabinofuranosidase domain-containing protein [Planctomycetota bacterium]